MNTFLLFAVRISHRHDRTLSCFVTRLTSLLVVRLTSSTNPTESDMMYLLSAFLLCNIPIIVNGRHPRWFRPRFDLCGVIREFISC